jgi:hypothetical protein
MKVNQVRNPLEVDIMMNNNNNNIQNKEMVESAMKVARNMTFQMMRYGEAYLALGEVERKENEEREKAKANEE